MSSNRVEHLTTEKIFEGLSKILQQGKEHSFVRKAVVTAICSQLRGSSVKEISPSLQAFLDKLARNELDEIVTILTEVYLKQRKNQKDGESEIEVNRHRYQIWIDSKRPQTDIEQVMLQWLSNDKYPIAQQVAMQAFIDFAMALEQEEENRLNKIREERQSSDEKTDNPSLSTDPRVSAQLQRDLYLVQFVAWFATLKAPRYRLSISHLLPEAWKQNERNQEVMDFVLRRWHKAPDREVKIISDRLKNGLFWAKYLWRIFAGGGILLTCVGILAVNIVQNLPNTTQDRELSSQVSPNLTSTTTPTLSTPTQLPKSSLPLYHTDKIPVGSYSYYEKNFKKQVSYIRQDNEMVGALYNSQQPNIKACFVASIGENQVTVKWWGNLELINQPGKRQQTNEYSIRAFTIDNVNFRSGVDNSLAVQQCQNAP